MTDTEHHRNKSGRSRRGFIGKLTAVGLLAPFSTVSLNINSRDERPLAIHVFSKHLHFLDYRSAAEVAAEIGFNGLDLTVRPDGHILPENVATELPLAISEIRKAGLTCELITTAISDSTNAAAVEVIRVAAQQGVKYYRSDWFDYQANISMEASLDYYQERVRQLGELNREHAIVGCYQNHSGLKVGASVWEVYHILRTVNPDYFGAQYDIRHAVAEGGRSWPNGIRLLKDHIRTIALKDFKWSKNNGQWQLVNVPIGEGMVDFPGYFKLLKRYGLNPPASLHLEYSLGGAEKGNSSLTVDKKIVFDAMKKDLRAVQNFWDAA